MSFHPLVKSITSAPPLRLSGWPKVSVKEEIIDIADVYNVMHQRPLFYLLFSLKFLILYHYVQLDCDSSVLVRKVWMTLLNFDSESVLSCLARISR